MKKIIFILFIFIFNWNVSASTETANSYILMDQESQRVLKSKNMNDSRLIASITKIMTAIIAIESNKLDDIVVVNDAISSSTGSGIYIKIGEKITLRDLIYGLMLRSGNDAALMISNYLSGSEEEFVKKMNLKAQELGMKNTTFVNSSGLDNDNIGNYSSAYDMAILTSYAMKNDEYQKIVKTKKYLVKTNYKTYIWYNKNKLLKYDYITGGKTGYTKKAKRTLVSTASINNLNLVIVTLNDSDDWNTHIDLYKYAKNNYSSYKILDKGKISLDNDLYHELYYQDDFYLPLKKDERKSLSSKIKLYNLDNYYNHQVVGINEISINNQEKFVINIYAVKDKNTNNNFFERLKSKLYD